MVKKSNAAFGKMDMCGMNASGARQNLGDDGWRDVAGFQCNRQRARVG